MRNVIIQCLLCASVTFGIWIAVFSIYLRYNHVKKQAKIQEKGNPFIWSLGEKLQSKPDSVHIPRAYNVRVERQSEDEPAEPKLLLRLGENFNYSIPELRHGYSTYGFNPIISKNLGHYRNVPDTRNVMCRKKTYPAKLPTASIIICFHNEEFSALFRTLSSIMTLTSQYILEEIILVDDMSDFDDLKEKLDYHLEIFRGKIKLIRNKKREGLIRARMTGASHASGDVLVFLDSHCEVNKVWLEPLLNAVAKDPKMVVCPLIDVIDYLSLEYQPSPIVRGAFNWHLEFKWDHVFSYEIEGPEGPTTPIRSPAMPGGIFAISRHYFNEIGQYDKGMNLWGGENLELSLRIWMCGGQLYVIPCSRVGHINRQHMTNHSEVIKAMEYNNLRLVHTWLDEYKVKDTSLVWEDESEQRGTSSEEAFYCLPDTKFCAFPYIRVQVVLVVKNPPANAGRHKRHGFHPWVGRSPGEGHGYPLQYSCLENPKDRGAWGVTVHRIAKRRTGLKPLSTHVPFQFVTHSFSDPIRD